MSYKQFKIAWILLAIMIDGHRHYHHFFISFHFKDFFPYVFPFFLAGGGVGGGGGEWWLKICLQYFQ